VYIGGGIGEHAFSAKLAFTGVRAEDLLPIIVGAIEVFKREGEKRGFKWVVAKYGVEKVKGLIMEFANGIKSTLPKPPDLSPKFVDAKIIRLHFPTGWVGGEDLERVINLAYGYGFGYVIIFNNQTIYIPIREVSKELEGYEIKEPGPFHPEGPTTVACLGNELCPPGLIDTSGIGTKIHVHLRREYEPIRVGISGCTHDCGMSWVSDIGFEPFGSKTRVLITVGGGPTRLGQVVGTIDPGDMEAATEAILELYAKSGVKNMAEFVTKYGVDGIREELARRVPSFMKPDQNIKIVFGPN
jgi:Sulfite reductase, beta subunit (hemoprotein)